MSALPPPAADADAATEAMRQRILESLQIAAATMRKGRLIPPPPVTAPNDSHHFNGFYSQPGAPIYRRTRPRQRD